jgi:hypothetical protein
MKKADQKQNLMTMILEVNKNYQRRIEELEKENERLRQLFIDYHDHQEKA